MQFRPRPAGRSYSLGGPPCAHSLSDTNLCDSDAVYDALDMDTPHSEHEVDAVATEVVSRRVFGGLCIEQAAAAPPLSEANASRR
jgi:hypothetical protein